MAVSTLPEGFPRAEIERVQALGPAITAAAGSGITNWYHVAGVNPTTIQRFIQGRLQNLEALADLRYWEDVRKLMGGGALELNF